MKTEIPSWYRMFGVKASVIDDIMPEPPCEIYRVIRSIEEYKALPDTIVKDGFEYKKIEDRIVRYTYPHARCVRTKSRCTACSCAETVCRYKLTDVTCAIYTRK